MSHYNRMGQYEFSDDEHSFFLVVKKSLRWLDLLFFNY